MLQVIKPQCNIGNMDQKNGPLEDVVMIVYMVQQC